MQISCICNVYESCESWLGPALYRIGKDSLTRRLRNTSFSKIGVTPPPHPTTSFSALLICELRQSTNRWWIGLATVKTASEIRYDLVQAANNKEQIYLIIQCAVVVLAWVRPPPLSAMQGFQKRLCMANYSLRGYISIKVVDGDCNSIWDVFNIFHYAVLCYRLPHLKLVPGFTRSVRTWGHLVFQAMQ